MCLEQRGSREPQDPLRWYSVDKSSGHKPSAPANNFVDPDENMSSTLRARIDSGTSASPNRPSGATPAVAPAVDQALRLAVREEVQILLGAFKDQLLQELSQVCDMVLLGFS